MARIVVMGSVTSVELTSDEEGGVQADCMEPECPWTEHYDDWNDATEYVTDHADQASGTRADVTHWRWRLEQ